MPQQLSTEHYDVVVVGAGSSGVAAAIAAANNGMKTVLIDSGPTVGGELISGMPLDGCLNVRGEWILGGIGRQLLDSSRAAGGFMEAIFDWRQMWAVCVDPEMLRLTVTESLARAGVRLRLYTFVEDVVMDGSSVHSIIALTKGRRILITGKVFIDCSGDGDVAALAGAPWEMGSATGELQPVTLIFRVQNVDYEAILAYQRDHPEYFVLSDNPMIKETPAEAAAAAYEAGYPFCGMSGDAPGSPLTEAIRAGRMYPTMAVYTAPTSVARREVQVNSTRTIAIDGGLDTASLSASLAVLTEQIRTCMNFCKTEFPGFKDAVFAGAAPRIGVRETRRIMGDYVLTREDVVNGRKSPTGVAKGGHHIDIHGSGTDQIRESVKDGKSYDIPYGALLPKGLDSILVAGRCFSSTREANGSARVMGACLAMGQATGTAAAMAIRGNTTVRNVPVDALRALLEEQGAILQGTA